MKFILFLFLFCVVSLLNSCKEETSGVNYSSPGKFGLSVYNVQGEIQKSSPRSQVGNHFDLGEIKKSRMFYFLLSNQGEEPIFDIEIESDNENIVPQPSMIDTLNGISDENSFGNAIGLMSLLSINVIHGISLEGIGYAELLPPGEISILLTISGKTFEQGAIVNISETFILSVNAKLMDVRIFEKDQEIKYLNYGKLNDYDVDSIGDIKIYNTGNVPVNVCIGFTVANLNPDDSLFFKDYPVVYRDHCFVTLYSEGVISDFRKFEMKIDGSIYLTFQKK